MAVHDALRLVIVGHVDHGKSTLIGRLLLDTGCLPRHLERKLRGPGRSSNPMMSLAHITDQLQKEREQDITIDTTQVYFRVGGRNYVIIDTPGHEQFLRNMITGSSQAQVAMLLVDVGEGVQEQTRRHAFVLQLLGIKEVVVVCNKMDLVGYQKNSFVRLCEAIAEMMASVGLEASCIVPLSAREGVNVASSAALEMPWYSGSSLLDALSAFQGGFQRKDGECLRFPVQDVYTVDGAKVAVGRIASGSIKKGKSVTLLPSGSGGAVQKVLVWPGKRSKAHAGENIGVILGDRAGNEITRGSVVVEEDSPLLVGNEIQARIFWLSDEPLRCGVSLTLRCSTQAIACCVTNIRQRVDCGSLEALPDSSDTLERHQAARVDIKTDVPFVFESFSGSEELGRFVLERDQICAAGTVC